MIWSFIVKCLNGLISLLGSVLSAVLFILPDSPFQSLTVENDVVSVLAKVNYFLPLDYIMGINAALISCVLLWYGVQMVFRWIKMVE